MQDFIFFAAGSGDEDADRVWSGVEESRGVQAFGFGWHDQAIGFQDGLLVAVVSSEEWSRC